VRHLETLLRSFLGTQTGSAAVLLVAALAWVNIHPASYERIWHTTLTIQLGGAAISGDLRYRVVRFVGRTGAHQGRLDSLERPGTTLQRAQEASAYVEHRPPEAGAQVRQGRSLTLSP